MLGKFGPFDPWEQWFDTTKVKARRIARKREERQWRREL